MNDNSVINDSKARKELLKHLLLELHKGEAPQVVRTRLVNLLAKVPYHEVVEVEQELIAEGLPEEDILEFCDIHTQVLDGHIDLSGAEEIPPGHPVDTFQKENRELEKVISAISELILEIPKIAPEDKNAFLIKLHTRFNEIMDVEKHYLKKEYLLFPFLEKHGITGPPKVMWGKHDQTRELLKAALEVFADKDSVNLEEFKTVADIVLVPAVQSVSDMIMKEEEILLPMSKETLTVEEWYDVYKQTMEFGYCLYDPQEEWEPELLVGTEVEATPRDFTQLSTGSLTVAELEAIFKILPIDITFVDKDDKVKFFTLGPERIFPRNRAIIGRDVRLCHPPSSVNIVERILEDFKSGKESVSAFWIQMRGKFILIEYYALRDKHGEYLGTIEFTQDITKHRELQGEQRLLSYGK